MEKSACESAEAVTETVTHVVKVLSVTAASRWWCPTTAQGTQQMKWMKWMKGRDTRHNSGRQQHESPFLLITACSSTWPRPSDLRLGPRGRGWRVTQQVAETCVGKGLSSAPWSAVAGSQTMEALGDKKRHISHQSWCLNLGLHRTKHTESTCFHVRGLMREEERKGQP